jgi:hypothetical protein
MNAKLYPEFECDNCCRVIVVSPRLLTDHSIIRCPNCQNVFGAWGNLQKRYLAHKDDEGILRLSKSPLADSEAN